MAASATMDGRLYSQGGDITIGDLANIVSSPPDTSPVITLGVLSDYMIYSTSGNVTRTSSQMTNLSKVLTGNGNVTNFGSPYDGPYSTIVQPQIWVDFCLYKDGVMVPESMRCIQDPVSDCHQVSMLVHIDCEAGDVVDVRVMVTIEDTSCQLKNRSLNLTRVYV
jgi:hypothetical protein